MAASVPIPTQAKAVLITKRDQEVDEELAVAMAAERTSWLDSRIGCGITRDCPARQLCQCALNLGSDMCCRACTAHVNNRT